MIVFSPFYENYGADTILCGAEPIYVPLRPPDFAFDPDELRRAFALKPKALVLCNPSNPSGKVFTRDELELIAGLAQEFDAWVITDEVYEHIVYPAASAHVHRVAARACSSAPSPAARSRRPTRITGWRLGYVIGPAEAIDGVRKVHDFLTVGAAAPLQEAAVTALELPDATTTNWRRAT